MQTGAYANAAQLAEDVEVAFQIVELTLDADDNVIERKVTPYPYQTRRRSGRLDRECRDDILLKLVTSLRVISGGQLLVMVTE